MADFSIVKDDLLPILTATLSDEVGPINLTGATVKFQMRAPGTAVLKIDAGATVVGLAVNGEVSYAWAGTDTDTEGLWIGWFLITYLPKTLTAPNPPLVIEVARGAG